MARERKRRQWGTGSVYQRKDGRWVGTVDAGFTERGTRRRISVTGKDEADAKAKLKAKQRQIDTEGAPDVSSRTTVRTWSEQWLVITQRKLRPKPWATDRSAVRKWIVPTIGHKRLDQLTPADLRAVENAQRNAKPKPKSTSTMHRTHLTLTSMLRAAVLEGHQVPARVFAVKAAELAVHDRTAMPLPDVLKLLLELRDEPGPRARWMAALLNAWRQGETLGLTWPVIDLNLGLAEVAWQLQPLPYVDNKNKALGFRIPDGYEVRHLEGAFHLTRPKTKAGYRMTPMVPVLAEALREWRDVAPDNPHDLVWPRHDGKPMRDNSDRAQWYDLQKRAGVAHPSGRPYTVHEARHTALTDLKALGTDDATAIALAGHSSVASSMAYRHSSQQAGLAALEALAARYELG